MISESHICILVEEVKLYYCPKPAEEYMICLIITYYWGQTLLCLIPERQKKGVSEHFQKSGPRSFN